MAIALTILGASGKMGKTTLELAQKDPHFQIVGLGCRKELSETPATFASDQMIYSSDANNLMANCDVAIDFTSHEAMQKHLNAAISAKKALVIGTTGHHPQMKRAIEEASRIIPILFSPNFSFGIALCLEMAARIGKTLFNTCTMDIYETHHIHKKDQPSGTALEFANAIENAKIVLKTSNPQPRKKDEIVIHSTRTGEVIGEHTLVFECDYERIELKHTAHSRDAFAYGALLAAKFLVKQAPGLYSLKDLFRDC